LLTRTASTRPLAWGQARGVRPTEAFAGGRRLAEVGADAQHCLGRPQQRVVVVLRGDLLAGLDVRRDDDERHARVARGRLVPGQDDHGAPGLVLRAGEDLGQVARAPRVPGLDLLRQRRGLRGAVHVVELVRHDEGELRGQVGRGPERDRLGLAQRAVDPRVVLQRCVVDGEQTAALHVAVRGLRLRQLPRLGAELLEEADRALRPGLGVAVRGDLTVAAQAAGGHRDVVGQARLGQVVPVRGLAALLGQAGQVRRVRAPDDLGAALVLVEHPHDVVERAGWCLRRLRAAQRVSCRAGGCGCPHEGGHRGRRRQTCCNADSGTH
jgi:hypothetical protein